jgi:hypothetical protein
VRWQGGSRDTAFERAKCNRTFHCQRACESGVAVLPDGHHFPPQSMTRCCMALSDWMIVGVCHGGLRLTLSHRGTFMDGMKHLGLYSLFICVVGIAPMIACAQTHPPAAAPVADPAEKHIQPVLAALKLADLSKETQVHDILAAQFAALRTWHAKHDAQIKPSWNEFNQARSAQNVTNANAALARIDGVYASFQPQHEKFLSDLAAVLTPEQVETVKDVLTVKKVKVTYDVYLQIFPTLTDAQKSVVLQNLKAAREQAIDCEAMTEKSAFFKKYKIKIEDEYLTAQGYDPKQARKDFAAKQKANATGKKPAEE